MDNKIILIFVLFLLALLITYASQTGCYTFDDDYSDSVGSNDFDTHAGTPTHSDTGLEI